MNGWEGARAEDDGKHVVGLSGIIPREINVQAGTK